MVWAKVALVSGLLLFAVAFGFGTEDRKSASVSDQSYDCGAAISASLLVTGTPDQTLNPGPGATAEQRQASSACRPVIQRARVMTLTTMGAGGLLALLGWAGLREHRESELRRVEPVHV